MGLKTNKSLFFFTPYSIIPIFHHSNIDGIVKSRLTGENRCPVFS